MKKIICALLLLLAVNSWSACSTGNVQLSNGRYYTAIACQGGCNQSCDGLESCPTQLIARYQSQTALLTSLNTTGCSLQNYDGCYHGSRTCYYNSYRIVTQCEADSIRYYANCIAQGNRWENCQCVEVTSADSLLYVCNDSPTPDGTSYQYKLYAINMHFENGTATTACGVSASLVGGDGYKQHCPVVRSGSGTCQSNGLGDVPPQECSDPSCKDDSLPKANCYAVVGSKCYMKDIYSGNTFSCECDGSCQQAIVNLVSGNCRNPYPPPSSSGSGGGDSSGSGGDPSSSGSGSDSSGSGSDSSGSGGGGDSSGSGGKDYTDQLNQIIANTQGTMNNTADISQWTQETMNNTIDINNKLTEMGVDVSHIRDNTAGTMNNTYNTANNTAQMKDRLNTINTDMNTGFSNVGNKQDITNERLGNINGKLNTTNDLLTALNAKEWSPQVDVSVEVGGDTNIINVQGDTNIINVQVDSSKAPAEIKGILETFTGAFDDFVDSFNSIFGGDDPYNANDTAGMGAQEKSLLDKIDSTIGDGIIVMNGDSVNKAMDGLYSGGYTAVKDSIANSAISDSMGVWAEKITDNGVITGNGSDNCPNVLTRKWNVTFPIGTGGVNVEIGPLGHYMCNDVAGMGITFWALCRVIIRAMVAIACMMWLYKSVLGIDGGSNEED